MRVRLLGVLCALFANVDIATAAPSIDRKLYDGISNCWNALAEQDFAYFADYDMQFEKEERPSETVLNEIWLGHVKTDLGEIELRALIRDNILIDCTMFTFPEEEGVDLIEFQAAVPTLDAWYSAKLETEGYFDTFPKMRLFATVRCQRGQFTMASHTTSFGNFDVEIELKGRTEPIPGSLRFVVHLGNPSNYEVCSGTGAL
ncbi:hypothetical protein [uncultured Litoreibacter sp.]|uniref:hypothetical protein n=1 Tax=uncultured Litoreibacter sp. TaxID=1392394 RepID=UPI0026325959|nr:hypothetical protein [uncultured Litoreibacter sp.]